MHQMMRLWAEALVQYEELEALLEFAPEGGMLMSPEMIGASQQG
jgi:hypothetical protein